MKSSSPADILSQIAQIKLMERGALSKRTFTDRDPQGPTHFKLQSWENGKNLSRHVSQEQLPLVQEALAGFAQFQELTGQLAAMIIADTRQQLRDIRTASKKKNCHPRSSSPKTKKSTA